MKYDFETLRPRWHMGASKWKDLEATKWDNSDVVPLSVADMEFATAPAVIEAVKKAADFGLWGYTGMSESFEAAVLDWMRERHGWTVDREWLVPFGGIVPAVHSMVRAFTQPGDGIILQTPVYYPFYNAVEMNGRRVVSNPLKIENGRYVMDYEDLEQKARDPKAKVLILCSPHNPVGRVWTRDELTRLGEICLKNDVLVISDEIHFDLVYKPHTHTVFATLGDQFRDNSIVCTAASKTFSLAGLQCSTIMVSDAARREALRKQQRIDGASFNSAFGTVATEAAYREGGGWYEALLDYLWGNFTYLREFLAEKFPKVTVYDLEGTYLTWFDCNSFGLSKEELEKFMQDEAGLYLDEGYIFGEAGTGFERLNLACPRSVLVAALDRLYAAAQKRGIVK